MVLSCCTLTVKYFVPLLEERSLLHSAALESALRDEPLDE